MLPGAIFSGLKFIPSESIFGIFIAALACSQAQDALTSLFWYENVVQNAYKILPAVLHAKIAFPAKILLKSDPHGGKTDHAMDCKILSDL